MRRIMTFIAALSVSVSVFAQAQITTKKEKLSDFPTKTMKVVLSGNDFIDQVLRDAVNNTWGLSPFEFCTMEEFKSLMTSEEYYFLLPVKAQYKKETHPGITMLTLVKGKPGAKDIDRMLEVTSLPMCAADSPSGREAAMLPGLLDIIQGYVAKSMVSGFRDIASYTKKSPGLSKCSVIISEDDLSSRIDSKFIDRITAKGAEVCPAEEADSIFMQGTEATLVSYTIHPAAPEVGSYCWNMFIDAKTHQLYYFRKHKISDPEADAGLRKGDIQKVL